VPMGNPATGGAGTGLDPTGTPSLPRTMQIDNFSIIAACTLAQAGGLQNPCTGRTSTGPNTHSNATSSAPVASGTQSVCPPGQAPDPATGKCAVATSCPDPHDQRYLLPCGPICPAGHLRSNENVCVCPQNCGSGMTNVDNNGVCTCTPQQPVCLGRGVACQNQGQCCKGLTCYNAKTGGPPGSCL
jgi:hypothetical protein